MKELDGSKNISCGSIIECLMNFFKKARWKFVLELIEEKPALHMFQPFVALGKNLVLDFSDSRMANNCAFSEPVSLVGHMTPKLVTDSPYLSYLFRFSFLNKHSVEVDLVASASHEDPGF